MKEKCIHWPARIALLWALASSPAVLWGAEAAVRCGIGPVIKTYGKTQWMVYSCADGRSLAMHSAPGSPALPFVFFLYPEGEGYGIYGEGTGSKEATAAAHEDLKTLSGRDIAALIAETKAGRN